MPKLAQICDIYYTSVTVKFYLIESRVFKDTSTGAPLATFTDSGEFDHKIYSSNSNTLYSLRSVVFNWLIFTDASINITDRNFAACVNYNHMLNNSDPEHFMSCTERNKITAAVANIEVDGDSVVLEVHHRSEGIYTCECRFSKMTLLHELDKYMVSNIHSVRSDMRSTVLPTGYGYYFECSLGDVVVKLERHLPNCKQNNSISGVQSFVVTRYMYCRKMIVRLHFVPKENDFICGLMLQLTKI